VGLLNFSIEFKQDLVVPEIPPGYLIPQTALSTQSGSTAIVNTVAPWLTCESKEL
jgi:hypothetical protein